MKIKTWGNHLAPCSRLLAFSALPAATSTWNNPTSGTWNVAGNWDGGLPIHSTTAIINNSGTAQLPTTVSGTYHILQIGTTSGGAGTINVSGGRLEGGDSTLGDASDASGAATVTSGTWISGLFSIGNSGTGSLLVNGGLLANTYGSIGERPKGSVL